MAANKGQIVLMGALLVGSIVLVAQPWTMFSKSEGEPAVEAVEEVAETPVQTEEAAPTEGEETGDAEASPTPTLPPTNLWDITADDYMSK